MAFSKPSPLVFLFLVKYLRFVPPWSENSRTYPDVKASKGKFQGVFSKIFFLYLAFCGKFSIRDESSGPELTVMLQTSVTFVCIDWAEEIPRAFNELKLLLPEEARGRLSAGWDKKTHHGVAIQSPVLFSPSLRVVREWTCTPQAILTGYKDGET